MASLRFGSGLSQHHHVSRPHAASRRRWFNTNSHASELTAGYYNTTTRDGYTPLLELCARHGANVTLTCVEMSDAQHPGHAQCGPEGLLRQIRATAAALGVPLSGENALRIFLVGGGIDATALDRIVDNTRAWALGSCGDNGGGGGMHGSSGALRGSCEGYGSGGGGGPPLRSVSSWPSAPVPEYGPPWGSGAGQDPDASGGDGGGSGGGGSSGGSGGVQREYESAYALRGSGGGGAVAALASAPPAPGPAGPAHFGSHGLPARQLFGGGGRWAAPGPPQASRQQWPFAAALSAPQQPWDAAPPWPRR
jgi:hypothetical protein